MRYKEPGRWAERTASAFLWLPKFIDGERRWLERATWVERFIPGRVLNGLNGPGKWDAAWWVE